MIRKLLRKAERFFRDPSAEEALRDEGIVLGPTERIDLEQFLAEADADSTPSVNVTVYAPEADVAAERERIEDALSDYVEQKGIGSWLGSGQGSIGDDHFFDVSFTVEDVPSAFATIREKLVELGVPGRAEIAGSDGSSSTVP